jgi:hypothetical protein
MIDQKHTQGELKVVAQYPGALKNCIAGTYKGEFMPVARVQVPEFHMSMNKAEKLSEANAERLTACWNACAGLSNPEAEVKAMRAALIACADKLERVSAAARGDKGHSEHTINVLHQARVALKGQPQPDAKDARIEELEKMLARTVHGYAENAKRQWRESIVEEIPEIKEARQILAKGKK